MFELSFSGLGEKLVEYLEFIVLMFSVAVILYGIIIISVQLYYLSAYRSIPTSILSLFSNTMLPILDEILVLIIGIDIMRTLAVALKARALYVRAALEAALLAVVREVIGAEIRHRGPLDLIFYVCSIIALVIALILFERYVPSRARS